jgi:hypothetical protein
MSRLSLSRMGGQMIEQRPSNWKIMFDRYVFDYMLYELHRYPDCEEGGKYIGYVNASDGNASHPSTHTITITDFLPGGPKAKRTAVEFLPDGNFQENLFRQAEARDPDIEHIGTWHSHHCNGLRQLSDGDVAGYFRTIQKAAYRPDAFVASLVKHVPRNSHDTDWIDHFLFVRDDSNFYKITNHTGLTDAPSKISDITGHFVQKVQDHRHADLWYETDAGRRALAEDKKLFTTHFDANVRATRRDGVINITCNKGLNFMSVTYPAVETDHDIRIDVGSSSQVIFRLVCNHSNRGAAYAACFEGLRHI